LLFICQELSSFHSYQKPSVLPFSATAFGFCFCLDLRSDLLISFYQGVFFPLDHVGFPQKSWIKKVRMVLEKRKGFMQKSGTERACLDCGLDFFMSCLMYF
jgi:hypothetical protein